MNSKKMKPILFNSEMVRAILDGRKTQTRRVMKHPKGLADVFGHMAECKQPFMKGDILWVRETWCSVPVRRLFGGRPQDGYLTYYRADYHGGEEPILRWRPSIHMPKEAARIFLRVTDVRLERLQDIDEYGAIAEGLYKGWQLGGKGSPAISARQAFVWLWETITRKAPAAERWTGNPWVWVIEFERCEKEDAEIIYMMCARGRAE